MRARGRRLATVHGRLSATFRLSICDRWQKCSRGFVVQAKAHESHGLRDAQTALQAPAEQFCVTNRQEEAGAGKCLGGADEGLEFAVALADGVSKETEGCGVAGNSPVVLDDAGRALPDRVEQFPTAIMTVDLPADAVAGLEVAWGGRSDAIPGHHVVDGRALEAGEWFADVVTELGIQGERTHVIAGLY